MDKRVQCEINRYICSRMLEDECDFNKVNLNHQYERYYSALKRSYRAANFDNYPVGKKFIFDDYYTIIRSALCVKNMEGKPIMKTIIVIYLITKHLVVEYNEEEKGFYFCGWMNQILDECDINWTNIERVKETSSCQIL